MKKLKSVLFSLLVITGCGQEENSVSSQTNNQSDKPSTTALIPPQQETQQTQQIFDDASRTLFKFRAVSASLYGIPDKIAGYHYASTLEDYSPENEALFRKQMRAISQTLSQLDNNDENIAVMEDIASYYAGSEINSMGFIDSWMGHSAFILNQINGPMIDIPNNLINAHTINSLKDAKDYLNRLEQFEQLASSILAKAKKDEDSGWFPPKVIITKTTAYLQGFSKVAAAQSALVVSFNEKLDKLDSISEADKAILKQQAQKLVATVVYPAFEQLADYTKKLEDKGRQDSGIWAQPGGDKFYQYSIRRLGDTDLSADEIHRIGLNEVERITQSMDIILTAQGYNKGTVGERMVALSEEDRFLYPNSDAGRAELLADLNNMIDEITKKMPDYFATVPPYKVEVKRIPVATQDSSAGGYYTPPTLDGSVAGIYWINLKNTAANPKFDLKTLTYHEAVPGHHWQVALNLAQQELPMLRRLAPYNAYVEGWALYSEKVAAEMGLYKNDPFSDLGRLKAELFRAVRLVVDTGLHAKKWSREQAIEYMAAATGAELGDVTSEIERYMVWPGQALGYKLGMLKILQLREQAKQQLGDSFDLKQFHDVVLLGGAVPMKVLQLKIENWITTKKSNK